MSCEPFSKCHLTNPITLHLYRKEPHSFVWVLVVSNEFTVTKDVMSPYHNIDHLGIVSIHFPVGSEWLELCSHHYKYLMQKILQLPERCREVRISIESQFWSRSLHRKDFQIATRLDSIHFFYIYCIYRAAQYLKKKKHMQYEYAIM